MIQWIPNRTYLSDKGRGLLTCLCMVIVYQPSLLDYWIIDGAGNTTVVLYRFEKGLASSISVVWMVMILYAFILSPQTQNISDVRDLVMFNSSFPTARKSPVPEPQSH